MYPRRIRYDDYLVRGTIGPFVAQHQAASPRSVRYRSRNGPRNAKSALVGHVDGLWVMSAVAMLHLQMQFKGCSQLSSSLRMGLFSTASEFAKAVRAAPSQ